MLNRHDGVTNIRGALRSWKISLLRKIPILTVALCIFSFVVVPTPEIDRRELQSPINDDNARQSPSLSNRTICYQFHRPSFTASHLWQTHLTQIVNASKNPLIPDLLTTEEDQKMHSLLFETLPASRMRRAVQNIPSTSPSQRASVRHVFEVIQRRLQDPKNNPPLRIAVFGGSVTIGRGCEARKRAMQNYNCAWPMRLQLLINQFFEMELVKVYNLGIGGTGSGVATNIVKYWMYPSELAKVGPDVVVNSYSTNDSLPPWDLKDDPDADLVTAVLDQARDGLQQFVRAALTSNRCGVPPLVVHVDDYLGPQQDSLLGDMSYNTAMLQLAKWYDTFAISYGDLVRDIAWLEGDSTFANKQDVHFSNWAHQTIAWSVGFASLELLSNFCDDEFERSVYNLSSTDGHSDTIPNNNLYLPPPLTRELLRKDIETKHSEALKSAQESYKSMGCSSKSTGDDNNEHEDKNPCIVSWIATPGGYGPPQISRFMDGYSKNSGVPIRGWKTENQLAEGWGNKIGWVATQSNATFTLQFDLIEKDVNSVTVFYLRSYGEKWADSNARFTVSKIDGNNNDEVLSTCEIAGVSEDQHSLTLSQELQLSHTVQKGNSLRMKVDLIGGNTFKIMGLMICT